jgi:hypothetical protein
MQKPYVIEKNADRQTWAREYNDGEYDGIVDLKNNTYYVEDQTQIKSATDNIGTFDKDNPSIRFSRELDTEVKAPVDGMAVKDRQKLKDLQAC